MFSQQESLPPRKRRLPKRFFAGVMRLRKAEGSGDRVAAAHRDARCRAIGLKTFSGPEQIKS